MHLDTCVVVAVLSTKGAGAWGPLGTILMGPAGGEAGG